MGHSAAIDVYYEDSRWIAACVVFADWQDSRPVEVVRASGPDPRPYKAGRFYQRELPCLISVLERAGHEFDTILIDGYVHLKTGAGKGLGAWLFESLPYSPAVVGVAKNPLKIADRFVPIQRGRSKKPLFISAIGWQADQAVQYILTMHGPYRIPTLIKIADRQARAGTRLS
ncbi:MAG: hypothetical protein KGY38_06745 [Desulfobacterales bacterium]|nr:hypothetical protein [Desulfobacterales bacterium]